jgi:hypothetical protein
MSGSPISPPVLTGGLILLDGSGTMLLRTIPFQYNPETLSRTLTPRAAKIDSGDRLEALRLIGPPVETMKLDIEIDAVDRAGSSDGAGSDGVAGDLAAIETILSPAIADMANEANMAAQGTLEILPSPAPMVLLSLGPNRVSPVRIMDLGIVEEMFDLNLTPIRAKLSLTLRVLSSDDMAPGSRGAALFLAAQQRRERLAGGRAQHRAAFAYSGVT